MQKTTGPDATWVRLVDRLHDVTCETHGVIAAGVRRYRDALQLAMQHQASHGAEVAS